MKPLHSESFRHYWNHFQEHRDVRFVKCKTTLSCGQVEFKHCPYVTAHPHIFLAFLLNGFFMLPNASIHKEILSEVDIGITYHDLQQLQFVDLDGGMSRLGWKLYISMENCRMTPKEFLHVLKNSAMALTMTDQQLKQYLADQCLEKT